MVLIFSLQLSKIVESVYSAELHVIMITRGYKNFSEISPRLARSRQVNRNLGKIAVILGENFSGQKMSAKPRRHRVNQWPR